MNAQTVAIKMVDQSSIWFMFFMFIASLSGVGWLVL
jgi:hypothetical protein